MVPLEKCLEAARECDAPMVCICGGEPLIYPKIEELVAGLLATRPRHLHLHERHVHAEKNAGLPRRDLFAGHRADAEKAARPETDFRQGRRNDPQIRRRGASKVVIRPTKWMYWNVHVDGLEFTHDLIVEREGVFKECVEAIKMAKILGYQVATNTTVYKETDVAEIEDMFKFLSSLEVDGHTISPG